MRPGVAGEPAGRFVTLVSNPLVYDFDPLPDYRKYGSTLSLADRASRVRRPK